MKWKKVLWLLLGGHLFLVSLALAKESIPLQDCTLQARGDQLTITFQFPDKIKYRSMLFKDPDRLVLDFTDVALKGKISIPENKMIKNYRASDHDHLYLRLVFDLKQKVNITSAYADEDKTVIVTLLPSDSVEKKSSPVKSESLPESSEKQDVILEELTPIKLSKHLDLVSAPPSQNEKKQDAVKETSKKPGKDIIVVIDPGHGGKDPGASGPNGTMEKDIVLKIAKQLKAMVNEEPGFYAVLTRSTDCYLPLRKRLAIARKNHADMFIAIHADAYHHHHAEGASVYALSQRGATSEAARWLAEKENESELVGLSSELADKDAILRSVLIDLSQTHTIESSLLIGNKVLQNLGKLAHLHHPRVEQAAFVVLKSPDIPSILVEVGFLSNPQEENKLVDPSYQHQTAFAIKEGIRHYFSIHSAGSTWFTDNGKKKQKKIS
jgi:N-acetylmuramoyl-L-alanine amidase